MLKTILITAATAGLGTSLIEYLLGYNAIDYLKDTVVGLYMKVKGWLLTR